MRLCVLCAMCCAELGGFCLPHSDGCLLLVGGRSCIFGGRWRLVAFGTCSYIFAKLTTSWKTDANQQIIFACTHSKSWFWWKKLCLWANLWYSWEETSVGNNYLEKVGKTKPAGPSASLSHSLGRWSLHRLGGNLFCNCHHSLSRLICFHLLWSRGQPCFSCKGRTRNTGKWINSMKGRNMIFSQW